MMDEMRRVLDMVAEGTVTPEQAAELIDALNEPTEHRSEAQFKPSAETARARARGSVRPEIEEIAEAAMFGVNPQYIREMHEALGGEFTKAEIREMAMFGVTPDFVRDLQTAGYTDLTPQEVARLAMAGANIDMIRSLRAAGFGSRSR